MPSVLRPPSRMPIFRDISDKLDPPAMLNLYAAVQSFCLGFGPHKNTLPTVYQLWQKYKTRWCLQKQKWDGGRKISMVCIFIDNYVYKENEFDFGPAQVHSQQVPRRTWPSVKEYLRNLGCQLKKRKRQKDT